MIICFFLVFGYFFYLLFFIFWILSWLLCSITKAHILLHKYCRQFSCVSGCLHNKWPESLCYEWLQPSDTLRGLSNHYIVIKTLHRASVLSSNRRGFMVCVCVEISWTCLGGWKDVLFFASLLVVIDAHWFGFWCRNLYGFKAVLLCNGRFLEWFYFCYFGFFMARDQSRPSAAPHMAVSMNSCKHVSLHHLRILCNLLDCYFVCNINVHLVVYFGWLLLLWPFPFQCKVGSWGCKFLIRFS